MAGMVRRAGIVTATVLVHALLVVAGTGACLAGLVLAAYYTVWRGLEFPIDPTLAARLVAGAAAAVAIGIGLHRLARRCL